MRRLLSLLIATLASTLAYPAQAATFPAPGDWIAITQLGVGIGDPTTDGQGNGREIVGDAANPAVFTFNDGTHFFLRMRIDTNPLQAPGNLRPYGWGILIDTDGNYASYELALMVNGITEQIEFAENTSPTNIGDPQDTAETPIPGYPVPFDYDPPDHNIVVTATPAGDTQFNGDQDYFLDFAIPVADLLSTGIDANTPLTFFAGTSSSGNSISVDLAGGEGNVGSGGLGSSASDPVTIGGITTDSDGDGVGDAVDLDPNNPMICSDLDGDTCDDCAVTGMQSPANDGPDADMDGICDAGEDMDTDGDGLSDDDEIAAGTDPNDADSDDDGVLDGQEPFWDTDSDGDGLINALDPDSDDDGLFDGTELGSDCSDPDTDPANCVPDADGGATTTSPIEADTDGGGVSDGAEDFNLDGAVDAGEGDPNDPADDVMLVDTDGDGLSDGLEGFLGTDPNDGDSDDDGVLDGDEPNLSDDTDGDGLINALDPDSDDDGILDGTELGSDCSHPDSGEGCVSDGDGGATTTNPLLPDTDGGGVDDGDEDVNHNGVVDEGETDPNDPSDDIVTPPECQTDSDCGGTDSGLVCSDQICAGGCRGSEGNGCPDGLVCTSSDETVGECVSPESPAEPDGIFFAGGCNCSTPGPSRGHEDLVWLLALGAAAAWSRRRR